MITSSFVSTHPVGSPDLHVDTSFGASININLLWNHILFSKSSGLMFASQAINHGCLAALSLKEFHKQQG